MTNVSILTNVIAFDIGNCYIDHSDEVLKDNDVVYIFMLNQTNIANNNNKWERENGTYKVENLEMGFRVRNGNKQRGGGGGGKTQGVKRGNVK